MLVQVADGAGIVVLNDDGPAFRMPVAEGESVNIPSVMTSKVPLLSGCHVVWNDIASTLFRL